VQQCYFSISFYSVLLKLLLWNDCKLTATWRGFILFRFDTVFPTSQCYNATFLILFIAPFSFILYYFLNFSSTPEIFFFTTLLFLKGTLGFPTSRSQVAIQVCNKEISVAFISKARMLHLIIVWLWHQIQSNTVTCHVMARIWSITSRHLGVVHWDLISSSGLRRSWWWLTHQSSPGCAMLDVVREQRRHPSSYSVFLAWLDCGND
jgi:hypothetical protein